MFWKLLRLDFANLLRDRGTWAALLGFALLAGYAAVSGASLVRAEASSQREQQTNQTTRLDDLKRRAAAVESGAAFKTAENPRDPHLVGRQDGRVVAALPLSSWSSIAVGQRDLLPQTIVVTSDARLGDAGAEDSGSLARRVNGAFDLAFVMVYLLPLLVISLSFDLIGAERERGTLAMVLSQPISVGRYCAFKCLSRATLLGCAVLPVAFLLPLLLGSGARLDTSLLYLLLLISYAGFWLLLAVWVNSVGKSSAGNALALIGFWLVLVVVLPGAASVAVDTLHPSPSRVALVNQARSATEQAEAEVSALEGDHGQPKQPDLALSQRAVEVQADLEGRLEPVVEAFSARLAEQQSLVDRLRFISPAIVVYEGMNDVAGSGVRRHQDFDLQVKIFHAEYKEFYFKRVRSGRALSLVDHASLPAFSYAEPEPQLMLRRVGAGALSLLGACLLLALAAARRFRGYLNQGLR